MQLAVDKLLELLPTSTLANNSTGYQDLLLHFDLLHIQPIQLDIQSPKHVKDTLPAFVLPKCLISIKQLSHQLSNHYHRHMFSLNGLSQLLENPLDYFYDSVYNVQNVLPSNSLTKKLGARLSRGLGLTRKRKSTIAVRSRYPRAFYGQQHALRIYNEKDAMAQSWLQAIAKGQFRHDEFEFFCDIEVDKSCAIFTNRRFLLLTKIKGGREVELKWEAAWETVKEVESITGARSATSGILFLLDGSEYVMRCAADKAEEVLNVLTQSLSTYSEIELR